MTEWLDLLAVPFLAGGDDPAIGLDCWGIAKEVNRRNGRTLLDPGAARPMPGDALDLSPLVRIADPTQPGDLIAGDPDGRGFLAHVATVVEPGWAITTSKRSGPIARSVRWHAAQYGYWRTRD